MTADVARSGRELSPGFDVREGLSRKACSRVNNQLKKIQQVLFHRAFMVSDYQSGYARNKRHRCDLLDDLRDLADLADSRKMPHSGTLVLLRGRSEARTASGEAIEILDVLDGQRLRTTLASLSWGRQDFWGRSGRTIGSRGPATHA